MLKMSFTIKITRQRHKIIETVLGGQQNKMYRCRRSFHKIKLFQTLYKLSQIDNRYPKCTR